MASTARSEPAAGHDHPMVVSDLRGRIDLIERHAGTARIGEMCRQTDALRHIATATRLIPLARLAGGLQDALVRDGRGVAVVHWTAAMRESIGHHVQDEATAGLFLASIGVRLAD